MSQQPKRSLALDALAAIQVMEAEPEITAFRDEWLEGSTLPDWQAAMQWLEANRGSPSGSRVLGFEFKVQSIEIPVEVFEDTETARTWWSEWLAANLDKLVTVPLTPAYGDPLFDVVNEKGQVVDALFFDESSGLAAFRDLVDTLVERYHWSDVQAQRLVLLGQTPVLKSVRVEVRRTMRLGTNATLAAGPGFTEITLRCRPQATQQEVSDGYEIGRRWAFEKTQGMPAGERIRATTSERTRDQAILGARVARGDFESWRKALDTYLAWKPDERHTYAPEYGEVDMGRFRRDTRAAYRRVVGFDLNFRPTKRKRPEIDMECTDGGQPEPIRGTAPKDVMQL